MAEAASRRRDAGPDGGQPPSLPSQWVEQDADLRSQVRLLAQVGPPYRAEIPHRCGGRWRYRLTDSPTYPLFRCLHCGDVSVEETQPAGKS